MIRSFRNKGLRRFTTAGDSSRLSVQNLDRLTRVLARLDVARSAEEMNAPGLRFHALVGDQKGRFSVANTGDWWVTFGWDGEDAVEVDLEDYH